MIEIRKKNGGSPIWGNMKNPFFLLNRERKTANFTGNSWHPVHDRMTTIIERSVEVDWQDLTPEDLFEMDPHMLMEIRRTMVLDTKIEWKVTGDL